MGGTMRKSRAKPWSDRDTVFLTRFYVEECLSVAMIARRMRRSDEFIRVKVKALGLERSEEDFRVKWDERREAAKARITALQGPTVFADKDEDHWRLCRKLGGFNVLQIVYPPRRAA